MGWVFTLQFERAVRQLPPLCPGVCLRPRQEVFHAKTARYRPIFSPITDNFYFFDVVMRR
jgi:hypothetical protein